jgi:tetratricopeptide (TPR) repeat protein
MPKKKPVAPETISAAEAIQLATQYINQGKPRKAVTELSRLLRSDNKNAEAYNLRGMARALDADWHMAIADFNQAIRYNPENAAAYVNRANLQLQMGDAEVAVEDFTEALRIGSPITETIYFHRGAAYFELGLHDSALLDFNHAILLKPDFDEAYHARGDLRRMMLDMGGAIGDYNMAIRLNPKAPVPYIRRAELLRVQRQYDAAIADYTIVIGMEPHVPDLYVERGQLYDRKKETAKAIADYQHYVEMGGSRSNVPMLTVSRRIFHLRLKTGFTSQHYKSRTWFIT